VAAGLDAVVSLGPLKDSGRSVRGDAFLILMSVFLQTLFLSISL
jgi:hypothetical protein